MIIRDEVAKMLNMWKLGWSHAGVPSKTSEELAAQIDALYASRLQPPTIIEGELLDAVARECYEGWKGNEWEAVDILSPDGLDKKHAYAHASRMLSVIASRFPLDLDMEGHIEFQKQSCQIIDKLGGTITINGQPIKRRDGK